MQLSGKRTLITGAGHGLGKAIAYALARAGSEVIVTDRDEERVVQTVAELRAENRTAFGYVFDVTNYESILSVRNRLHAERGPVDILVNNAGLVFGGEFLKVPIEKHRTTIDVNLAGLLAVTHAFLPDLIARPLGHLVNIASAAALVAVPWGVSYAASKAAVLAFSESLREELRMLGHRHVAISTVCPSFISTGLFAGAKPARLTWMLTPEHVARCVVKAIRRRKRLVILPWTARLLYEVAGHLPLPLYHRICARLGVSTSMVEWKGHAYSASNPSTPSP